MGGERIEILVDKTDNLNSRAVDFKKKSVTLKRAMWWKNIKLMIAIGVLLVILLYVFVGAFCGFPIFGDCTSSSNNNNKGGKGNNGGNNGGNTDDIPGGTTSGLTTIPGTTTAGGTTGIGDSSGTVASTSATTEGTTEATTS